MKNTFVIDVARSSDGTAILDLIHPIQADEFGIDIERNDQPDLQDVERYYWAGNGGFWLAKSERQIIGTIGLLDIGDGALALRKMFVHADWRGGHIGVAASLLSQAVEHARGQGSGDIFLGTTDKFHAAHRFYEKHGFSVLQVEELPESFPRMVVDSLFFHLSLKV